MLTVGSCFSGIGGLELGLEWTKGFKTNWQIEKDAYASAVLKKHWPDVARYSDIRDVVRPPSVDVIAGGFPCQDVSLAGARGGLEGKRSTLWSEMYRLVCEVKPRWVVAENVPGLFSSDAGRFFGNILGDLATAGYDAEWGVLSACSMGAPQTRERVFILGHPRSRGRIGWGKSSLEKKDERAADSLERSNWWESEPDLGRMATRIPAWIHGGKNAHESCFEEARTKGVPHHSALRDLWWFYQSPEAPPRPSVCALCAFPLSVVSREGRSLGWDVGAWTEEKEGLQKLRKGVRAVYAQSRSALRKSVSFTDWTFECSQTVENRKGRLKCLGNAVVPQVAQRIGEMILNYERGETK